MPRSIDALAPDGGTASVSIALVTDRTDWHARELAKALASLGARAIFVDLAVCGFDTATQSGLRIAGFADRLPDAVLVRSMAGGSFETVTLRLGILHALRETGVPVVNDARAIERCVDKSATSFLLARAGIPTPTTWAVESRDAAAAIVRRGIGAGPLVLKPLFGSQGRGLRLVRCEQDLPGPAAVKGVYYLQRYVGVERDGFRDFRLLVSHSRVVTAMMRHSTTWVTNIKRGGRPVAAVLDTNMKALALAAAAAVGADFAGVDIVHDADGRPTVLEVNSMPAWSGLQKVTSADIAAVLAADLMAALSARIGRGAAG
jgi:tetrahydromethanopterin:alpha-L-glutamate ligase